MLDKVESCGMHIRISVRDNSPKKLKYTPTDYLLHSTKALSIQ